HRRRRAELGRQRSGAAWITLALALSAPSAAGPPRSIEHLWSQATAQMRAGDLRQAARTLEHLTRSSPRDAAAWRALGGARLRLSEFAGAASAFDESLVIEPDSPRALFGLGEVYAAQHDRERAFLWLGRARSTHRYDMTEMLSDPHFAPLRA